MVRVHPLPSFHYMGSFIVQWNIPNREKSMKKRLNALDIHCSRCIVVLCKIRNGLLFWNLRVQTHGMVKLLRTVWFEDIVEGVRGRKAYQTPQCFQIRMLFANRNFDAGASDRSERWKHLIGVRALIIGTIKTQLTFISSREASGPNVATGSQVGDASTFFQNFKIALMKKQRWFDSTRGHPYADGSLLKVDTYSSWTKWCWTCHGKHPISSKKKATRKSVHCTVRWFEDIEALQTGEAIPYLMGFDVFKSEYCAPKSRVFMSQVRGEAGGCNYQNQSGSEESRSEINHVVETNNKTWRGPECPPIYGLLAERFKRPAVNGSW